MSGNLGVAEKPQEDFSESKPRPAVFIACLGTSPYDEISYAPYDGEPSPATAVKARFGGAR